jgi:hypothetical protein
MAAVLTEDDYEIGALVRQYFHLLEGLFQGVAVVRVAGKAANADYNALVQCGGDLEFVAKFRSLTDGKNQAYARLNTSQLINASSFTKACHPSIMSTGSGRSRPSFSSGLGRLPRLV